MALYIFMGCLTQSDPSFGAGSKESKLESWKRETNRIACWREGCSLRLHIFFCGIQLFPDRQSAPFSFDPSYHSLHCWFFLLQSMIGDCSIPADGRESGTATQIKGYKVVQQKKVCKIGSGWKKMPHQKTKKISLSVRDLNPGRPRDRRKC